MWVFDFNTAPTRRAYIVLQCSTMYTEKLYLHNTISYMYKLICKDLGFDCSFTVHNNDQKILANNFGEHVQVSHKIYYPKQEIFDFIAIQNKNQDATKLMKNKKSSCIDSCESFRLKKWHMGLRNYP